MDSSSSAANSTPTGPPPMMHTEDERVRSACRSWRVRAGRRKKGDDEKVNAERKEAEETGIEAERTRDGGFAGKA